MKNCHRLKGLFAACLLLPAVNASAVTLDFDLLGMFSIPGGPFGPLATGTERYQDTGITDPFPQTVSGATGTSTGDSGAVSPASDLSLSWTVSATQFDLRVEGSAVDKIFQNPLDPDLLVSLTINNLFLDLGFGVEVTSASLDVTVENTTNGDTLTAAEIAAIVGNGDGTGLGVFAFEFAGSLLNVEGNKQFIDVSIAYNRTQTSGPSVPEPATLALLGLGLLGIGAARRRHS